jgi:hypothetical protein
MKYLLLSCCLIGSLVTFVGAQDKEKDAIKKVIETETASFLNVNKGAWESTWLNAPYAYWSYSDSTGTTFVEGFKEITKFFEEYFKTQTASRTIDVAKPTDGDIKIERDWKEIRVYGNGAFTRHTQRVSNRKINMDETSHIRVLEKKDGQWKIVCVGVIASYPKD